MIEEKFQPISVKPPSSSPLFFELRCWVDLQLGSIVKHLRPEMARLHGKILDVGSGESPWREWLPEGCSYQGIDIVNSDDYGMSAEKPDVTYYDGVTIPFLDATYDGVICIEVLEHVIDPQGLLSEIARILKHGAPILLTVPWSARRHHIPHDFHRFTRERLQQLFHAQGFCDVRIFERGNNISVIANKMIVLTVQLLKPVCWGDVLRSLLFVIPVGTMATVMLIAAHLSIYFGGGSLDDPLGYFVYAVRKENDNLTLEKGLPSQS